MNRALFVNGDDGRVAVSVGVVDRLRGIPKLSKEDGEKRPLVGVGFTAAASSLTEERSTN